MPHRPMLPQSQRHILNVRKANPDSFWAANYCNTGRRQKHTRLIIPSIIGQLFYPGLPWKLECATIPCYRISSMSRQSWRRKGSPRDSDTFNSGLCQLGGAVGVEAADGAVVVDENLV